MSQPPSSSYDDVPYINAAFPQTHPDRLATMATLLGVAPPSLDGCRVLELGCASGDNVVPMAVTMPGARFVGIDLSRRQIDRGRETIEALKLDNVELRHGDILAIDENWGRFDFVIAHGVYSWVPAAVREKVLAVCRDNLAPGGIAYVSYNTLPGWRMRGMIRDMMVYHASQFEGAQQQVQQARALLDFLAQSVPADTPYGMTLKHELETVRTKPDAYLYHDHLEAVNEPVYFHEFAAQAKAHGLQYLADVELGSMLLGNFPPQVAQTLLRLGTDPIRAEQYMDFVRNRQFRQSLLVHEGVAIRRNMQPAALRSLRVASRATPESAQPSLAEGVVENYSAARGKLAVPSAIVKAALAVLAEQWPAAMPFEELVIAARSKLGPGADGTRPDDAEVLGTNLLQAYSVEAVELHVGTPRIARGPSVRPVASPLVRFQAPRGTVVTSLYHELTTIDASSQRLLPLLDGTRDRAALLDILATEAAAGRLVIRPRQGGEPLAGGSELREALGNALEMALSGYARAALLVE